MRTKRCKDCNGTGREDECEYCETCGGSGEIAESTQKFYGKLDFSG